MATKTMRHAVRALKKNGRDPYPDGEVPIRIGWDKPTPIATEAGTERIPCERIFPNPWQARQEFTAEDLEGLAAEIRSVGLLQPPVVRAGGAQYQLVCGERRLRACRDILGWTEIPCIIRPSTMTDAEMRRAASAENAARKDLSPIERARELQAMLDAGDAAGPTELGALLGISQSQVSNLIGLLRLPEEPWQRLVSQGRMSAAHARALAPWVEFPAVLKLIKAEQFEGPEEEAPSVQEFREAVKYAARRASRALTGRGEYDYRSGAMVPLFEPTAEQREQLRIVEVVDQFSGNEPLAFNVELWDRLQKAHRKTWLAQRRKDAKAKKKPGEEPKTKNQKQKPFDRKEQFRLKEEWFKRALLWLIARQVQQADEAAILRLLLMAAAEIGQVDPIEAQDLADAMGAARKAGWGAARESVLRKIYTLTAAELGDAARKVLANSFWRAKEDAPMTRWDLAQLPAIAVSLGVDLEAAWLDGLLAPHYAAWIGLLTDGERAGLAEQLGIGDDWTPEAILELMPTEDSKEAGPPLPKELAKLWKDGIRAGGKKR